MFDAMSILGIDALIVAGVALVLGGLLLSKIPILSTVGAKYKWAAIAIGVVVFTAGVYMKGSANERKEWQIKVAEAEAKVAKAEAEAKVANTKVETVYVDRVKKVVETKVVVQEKIRDISVEIDGQCKVSPKLIELLNNAAANKKPGEAK